MSATPFMQLYIADYLGDTQHLTTEQHGAYLLLLMAMWRAGGSLPNDPQKLARITRVSPRRWHLIAPDVMEFFTVDGGEITQKRLVEERKKASSISEKRSASGKLGGIAKALKSNDTAVANAKQTPQHSQKPEIIEKKEEPNGSLSETSSDPKPSRKRNDYPEAFEAAWKAYPTDPNMSKAEAFDAWKKLDAADMDALAASIRPFADYCRAHPDYRPIHMCRFIAKRRFDGFAPSAPKPETADESRWQSRLSVARQRKQWSSDEWGPPPGRPNCLVPKHLLQPTDGQGWHEYERAA